MPSTKLVIIDMQEAFRAEGSAWQVVGYSEASAQVERLIEHLQVEAIWTRFVRDPEEIGSWVDYYDHWSSFRVSEESEQWDLTLVPSPNDEIVTLPTFGKWGAEMVHHTIGAQSLVICGVATDCCVLSTVVAAVDAGKIVTLVADACAGATEEAHVQAISLMGMLSPMVNVVSTDQLIASAGKDFRLHS
jgi:nicotinamidase-related amidase